MIFQCRSLTFDVCHIFKTSACYTLSVVLYGYKTWYLTLRGEQRLRVFENRVLRRRFRPKRDEIIGD
jgi:hypothetical protein